MAKDASKKRADVTAKTPKQRASKPARRGSAVIDTRVIWCGDCLEQLARMPEGVVDLAYIDPPFNSNRDYETFWGETQERRRFEDRHESTKKYIDYMIPRCNAIRRVLKNTGSFYFHCDWHASHYVKVMLDSIFGESNFRSEIIWRRTNAKGLAFRGFPNNHDTIFYYTKSDEFTWNRAFKEYDPEYVEKFYKHVEEGTGRRYTLSDVTNPNHDRPNLTYEWKGVKRVWRWTKERMEEADRSGILHYSSSGLPRHKRYLDEVSGVPIDTVWEDIQPIQAHSAERLGYPTQKPLALLDRIIEASSNPNDIVLDAFCGCGTALVSAHNHDRQWIGIDISATACMVMAKRLRDVCKLPEDEVLWRTGRGFVLRDLPWNEEKLRVIPPFEFENWAVIAIGGRKNASQVGDRGIDGRLFPVSAIPQRPKTKKGETPAFDAFFDKWYPIQVKQKDRAGRPEIDSFEAVMMRENRERGYFIAFGFTADAQAEVRDFQKRTGKIIRLLTVREILDEKHTDRM